MRIKVRVVPRSRQEKIVLLDEGLKVYIREPAIDGRANKKLIEVLAKHYQVKKYNIAIIKGHNSRDKVVNIHADS